MCEKKFSLSDFPYTSHTKKIVFLFFLYQGQQVIVIRTHKGENDDEKIGTEFPMFIFLFLHYGFCVSICECGVAINKDKENIVKKM